MDIADAILKRKSIREFTVLSGQVLDSIREENVHLLRTRAVPEKEAAGN